MTAVLSQKQQKQTTKRTLAGRSLDDFAFQNVDSMSKKKAAATLAYIRAWQICIFDGDNRETEFMNIYEGEAKRVATAAGFPDFQEPDLFPSIVGNITDLFKLMQEEIHKFHTDLNVVKPRKKGIPSQSNTSGIPSPITSTSGSGSANVSSTPISQQQAQPALPLAPAATAQPVVPPPTATNQQPTPVPQSISAPAILSQQ